LIQQGMPINPQEYVIRTLEATEQPNIEALMEMPPPQPSMEQQQLEFEIKKFEEETRLKDRELDIKEKATSGKFIKDMADAEGVEVGQQLPQYQAMADQFTKEQQAAQQHLQKQDQHQQKMQQQQEMHQQKLAQQSAQGANDGTRDNTGPV